ncbi:disease resistance protein RPS4B-like [Bidens hawaiensis]|uniref:disease resistance protein RPS4B-like n=1 Tax=Bidens hawaiensis TaxID=980011 RepID=UPI004048FC97
MDIYVTDTILKACDINTTGITTLINTCLLNIGWDNELTMHQLLRELGRDLVREESPNMPWKRSRVWHHKESFELLKDNKGKGYTIGLSLDTRMLDKTNLPGSFELETNSFSNMNSLMLLQLNYVQLQGHYENFPKRLRWLCMHGFSLKSIPLDIPMENLVSLDMSYSNIESFDMSYSDPQPRAKRKKQSVEPRIKQNRLLGSLKILDLSFCEQLHSVGGFFKLPVLERLVARNCISLIGVRESVEQCVKLVHIDLRYCYKLKKIPISIGNLKKVETLLLDGCNLGGSDMDSSDIATISQTSSSSSCCLNFLPNSLIILSLTTNNLSNKSFPVDLSCLSMLENLYLDNNPIDSMPRCVRTLPRLKLLSMDECDKISSIEYPPRTLRELSVSALPTFVDEIRPLLKTIKFCADMSPIRLSDWVLSLDPEIEVDGIVKIQALADVEKKLLRILGWANLKCIKKRSLRTRISLWQREGILEESPIQLYYEFGIFSTVYEGEEMPNWISCRSKGLSSSFTIPSSPNNLRGLNFCYCVETAPHDEFRMPVITITNSTKKQTWIYNHYIEKVQADGKCICLLSHWMFGPNEMKDSDGITIDIAQLHDDDEENHTLKVIECGCSFVYDVERNEEEEDVLRYYRSWNHIIGGDLSPFQLKSGKYILDYFSFGRLIPEVYDEYHHFIGNDVYKEARMMFKAFSQKKKPNQPMKSMNALIKDHNQSVSLELPTRPKNKYFISMIKGLQSCPLSYAFSASPIIYEDWIKEFWATAVQGFNGNVPYVAATIQGQAILVDEDIIRKTLHINDHKVAFKGKLKKEDAYHS